MNAFRTTLRRDALVIAAVHVGVAAWYAWARGLTIVHGYGPDTWSWFWQNVPADLLRERALESLWHLHAQPPLWNALGAALLKLAGDTHLGVLHAIHVVLGAATAALCALLVGRITGRRGWAAAVGLIVALHPALLLYEAYALYTTLVTFLVVLAAWLLLEASERASAAWAVAFVGVLVALVLTRSLFHLVLLVPFVPLALAAGGRPSWRQAVLLAVLVLLPVGWYAKNQVQYGFFGGSSWYGMGIWRTALFRQDPRMLDSLLAEGTLEPVVRLAPFSLPSAYAPLGYLVRDPVPLLERDDFHNAVVPELSAAYQRSASALIRRTPGRYLKNVLIGYGNFSAPSTDFAHLDPNRARLGLHAEIYRWLTGRPLFALVEPRLGVYLGSLYLLVIPATLLAWALAFLRPPRRAAGLGARLRAEAPLAFIAMIVAYTVLVGCAMELGENVRFKFLVEPAFLVLLTVVAHRAMRKAFAARPPASPLETPSEPSTLSS